MSTEPLTAERILEATEEVLRRYGPAKATVVDVARVLGVSHGSVYRHFRTKAALREAVTKQWLSRTETALAQVISDDERESGPAKLREWLLTLFAAKRHKAGDDPELFATFSVLAHESSGVVDAHLAELAAQLTLIIEEGVRAGRFVAEDPASSAGAVFAATARFHDPAYAAEWSKPTIDAEFDAVSELLLRGLRA
ncbi:MULTISPECIES: TetR family transcriptional regulator [unclassified Streptomyces]|uniref:TetR family transcriptional regulator n=1 Tax=unclassified Streptomyces TaxID=2593676 RepID=UPI002E2CCB17|nr:TetR family transcriptional regulator [Streptomyces sp. NBC_01429]